jgi:predicted RNA polymerase sigma factor
MFRVILHPIGEQRVQHDFGTAVRQAKIKPDDIVRVIFKCIHPVFQQGIVSVFVVYRTPKAEFLHPFKI